MIRILTIAALMVSCAPLHAKLFVYEPFDYPVSNQLAGANGGEGFVGGWAVSSDGGGAAVFDDSSATTPVTGRSETLSWDGVVNNLTNHPQTNFSFVSEGYLTDKWAMYRQLERNAAQMAGPEKILWASMACHQFSAWSFGQHVALALSTDGFADRGKKLNTSGSFGSGAGDGIGVCETAVGSQKYSVTVFDNGTTNAVASSSKSGGDHLLVIKFEFGTVDTVSAYAFHEDSNLLESTFDANRISTTGAVDEATLNILTFSNARGNPAFDEIRVATTFEEVIGKELPPTGTLIQLY